MVDKNKIFRLDNLFTKELPTAEGEIDSIFIEGMASTNEVDRAGDVIPSSVWEAGMKNFLKNPIVLAYHDHDDPIGKVVEHKINDRGLWVKARISAAAAETFNLIKDGVLSAFSVSFRILDAEYNSATELFVVKELELLEISVVSIPCNQDTLFSLSKSFDSEADYKTFKTQFVAKSDPGNSLESQSMASSKNTIKEWNMTPEEIQKMVADAAAAGAAQATKAIQDATAEKAAKEKAEADAEAALQARIKKAVADVHSGESGAEKLMAEIEKRFAEQTEASKKILEGLEGTIAEKSKELEAIQRNKMNFKDHDSGNGSTYEEREKAVFLGKITGKGLAGTAFGKNVIEKTGAHLPSATWELEVSTNMEAEVRRKLIIAPLMRQVPMKTNVMTMPVNPEAGYGTWVTNAQFGTTDSSGAAATHQLGEITLNAYKLATKEFMAFEEEEDSLLVLLPIVRDAMIRRTARSLDKALLRGAGAGADPVKGLALYDATSVVTPAVGTGTTVANMRALREDLGVWGLDPADVIYIVATEVYYDLLDDTTFQTVDKVGDKATLLTGQIGSIGNSPVVVSGEFPTKASGASNGTDNIGAIAVARSNFIVGNQRGLRFDTDDLVEEQRKILVASMRMGMTQLTTNLGQGVSTLRWAA